MKRWSIYGKVEASTYLGDVEAETKEEAIEKAREKAHVSVCHQCADEISDPEVTELVAEEVKES